MKNTAFFLVGFTTLYLVFFIAFCQIDTSLKMMSILFVIGNLLIVLMAYKVLKDCYSTTKTFKNWYEDHPKTVEKKQLVALHFDTGIHQL